MPISSGAGGKAARLHLVNPSGGGIGGKSRSHWPNIAARASTKSRSTSALHQSISVISSRPSGDGSDSGSGPITSSSSQQRSASPRSAKTATVVNHQRAGMSGKQQQQRIATVDKYKQIRHISPPSSHATTSATAFKYFTTTSGHDNTESQSRPESPGSNFAGLAREDEEGGGNFNAGAPDQVASQEILLGRQLVRAKNPRKSKRNKMMSSLGGQRIVTGGQHSQQHEQPLGGDQHVGATPQTMTSAQRDEQGNNKRAASGGGLFSSLMMLGGQRAAPTSGHQQQQQRQWDQGNNSYTNAKTINQHRQQQQQQHKLNSQTSLNPSLSFASSSQTLSSAGNSAANLHSLASLHGSPPTKGLTTPTTTINKRINLKYVKTLIILLMSLDLAVTLFVHHFASRDEFSLVFTQHKLRFSLVNLVLSALWYIVLATAILFDIYAILLIGALVDTGSFILLLVCSVIHFTHRIDYNTVNMTSLLLLLFSIIVLHVYLIVIAALTIYLMTAVKRRRKH